MKPFTLPRTALAILCLGILIAWTGCATRPHGVKHVSVVFRFDDYSFRSDTDLERRLIDLFRRHRAPVTFAVIPFACAGDIHDPSPQTNVPLDLEKINLLRTAQEEGGVDVGLHGYSHQTFRVGRYAEFEGLDYDGQLDKLAEGKQYLEKALGTPVDTFIPPWNKYDRNTLKALEALGFTTISADLKGVRPDDSTLRFLPATCNLLQLRDAVATARAGPHPQPVLVVLFHEYDFREIDLRRGRTTFAAFSALMDWLGSQPDVRMVSVRQAVRLGL